MSERDRERLVEFEFQEVEQQVAPSLAAPCGCCMGCVADPPDEFASQTSVIE